MSNTYIRRIIYRYMDSSPKYAGAARHRPRRVTGGKSKKSKKSTKSAKSTSKKVLEPHETAKKLSRSKRNSKRPKLPKTANLGPSNGPVRVKVSRASSEMSVEELQFLAKSRGIPFGGLSKTKLIRKINNYY
jgi:hypothetical protein